jgi:hypothetical protein
MEINSNDLIKLNIKLSNCVVSCFSRSLDKHHKENNKLHLISSVVYIEKFYFNEYPNKIYSGESPTYYTFIINRNFEYEGNKIVYITGEFELKFIFIDFDYFINLFQNDSTELIINLFGKKNMEEKDY